jgi:hypothetical protein
MDLWLLKAAHAPLYGANEVFAPLYVIREYDRAWQEIPVVIK